MRVWRTTANGLEAVLAASCDTLLVLDEVGQTEGRDLGSALYMAISGVGKQRMQRDATLKTAHTWRVMVMSSGEMPVETKLAESGGRAHAGQLVRAIDIKASSEHGVFDKLEPKIKPEKFADQVKRASSTHYGTAGPAFVRALIEKSVSPADVRESVEDFVADTLEGVKDYHGQMARAALRFGLIATAGKLAANFKIVPWSGKESVADAKELFKTWTEERRGSTPHEARQALLQARRHFEAHGAARYDLIEPIDLDRRPVPNRAGYRKGKDRDERWLVLPEVFRTEICAGLNPREAAKALADQGCLVKGANGEMSRSEWIPGVGAGGKTQRVCVFTPAVFEGFGEDAE
jgi:putative DNA primase/helicase